MRQMGEKPEVIGTGSESYLDTDTKIMDFRLFTACYIPEKFFKFFNI